MIPQLIVLVKLLAAHLLGDFIFQSDKICRRKSSPRLCDKLPSLTLHAIIQAALSYLFIAQWSNWLIPSVILISHFIIDWIKSNLNDSGLKTFVVDQAAHYLIIILLWWVYYIELKAPVGISQYIFSFKVWVIFTAFVTVVTPSAILIKLFLEFEKWAPNDEYYHGLPNAGKWIGYLERILILLFIFTDNVEGVGFLLAAKSIFRFGELTKTKDLKITEYVLIGTFSSFAIAITIAYTALFVIKLTYE